MKSKILIIGLIAIIVIVAVFLVLQKEDVKINNSNEAINLIKEKYPEVANISKCENASCDQNIIVGETENGWNLTFWNGSVNCRGGCLFKDYYYFLVYENGSAIKVGDEKWYNKTVRIWTDKLEYKVEEVVKVYIFNGLDESISFSSLDPRHIEKFENDTWKEYYTYDPCMLYLIGIFVVNSQEIKLMNRWKQIYYVPFTPGEWCKKIKASSGEYRFNFQLVYYSNKFKIINSTKNCDNKTRIPDYANTNNESGIIMWTDKLTYGRLYEGWDIGRRYIQSPDGEPIKIYIMNTLKPIFTGYMFGIEREENNTWKEFPLYSPCVREIIEPEPNIVINQYEITSNEWNQLYYNFTEWKNCENYRNLLIDSSPGKYRIIISEDARGKGNRYYSNEFGIINSTKNGNNK